MAVGYLPNGEVASLTDLGWNRPCGQMYSTVEDLNRVSSGMFAHVVLHLVSFNLLCLSSWPCSSMRHTINHIFQSPVCLSHMYCQPCWGGKWAYLVRWLATTLLTVLYIATYAQGLSTLCTSVWMHDVWRCMYVTQSLFTSIQCPLWSCHEHAAHVL